MKNFLFVIFLSIVSAVGIAAQTKTGIKSTEPPPQNFVSDGCTHFPDGDYIDCCVQHDLEYFKGGGWTRRWQADGQLRKCVAAKQGWWHKPISLMMWAGVRIGGVPFLPTKFRWGFGKDIKPKAKTAPTEDTKIQK